MALTIRNITDQQIETAKHMTGKGTGAAAIVECIELAQSRAHTVYAQSEKIKYLQEKLDHANRVLERLASAADEALCIVRQRNLLQ